jgi:hypothetical protein
LKILQSLKGTALLVVALGALLAGCDGSDDSAATASAASGGTTPQASNTLVTRGATTTTSSGRSSAGTTSDTSGPSNSSIAPKDGHGISGTATISWDAPNSNTNGSALTDLSGYRIYFGASEGEMTETVQITNVGIQTYVIENLKAGTWYFAVQALSTDGTESPLSDVVSKTIG